MIKLYVILGITSFLLITSLLSSKSGLSELMHLEKQILIQGESLKQQREANLALENQIIFLQSNPQAIETIARQQLGLVKSDETFVEIIDFRGFEQTENLSLPKADTQLEN